MDTLEGLYKDQHRKQQEILLKSDFAVAVMGKCTEIMLVPLTDPTPVPSGLQADIDKKGLQFCGVLGWVDGNLQSASEPNRDTLPLMILGAVAFIKLLSELGKARSAAWLENLHRLEDPRHD